MSATFREFLNTLDTADLEAILYYLLVRLKISLIIYPLIVTYFQTLFVLNISENFNFQNYVKSFLKSKY